MILHRLLCVYLAIAAALIVIQTALGMVNDSQKLPIRRFLVDLIDSGAVADGFLILSELLLEPDYLLASSVTGMAAPAGFRVRQRIGGVFAYTVQFGKAL